jgi:aldose 1-epimerase
MARGWSNCWCPSGLPNLHALQQDGAWMGAFVGRFANRIGGARLRRADRCWELVANASGNSLHSGATGCSQQVFEVLEHGVDRLVLHCLLPDGADGFPGEIALQLTYELDDVLGLVIAWQANVRRAASVCSFTSHVYFNLSGLGGRSPVIDHRLKILASRVLALNTEQVPDGRILEVDGSPLDWRDSRLIGSTDFDQYWITAAAPGPLALQAEVARPESGVALEVWSTEPGLQFYAGGSLGGPPDRSCDQYGRPITAGAGLCLEPSGYPDAPSHRNFPDPWVEPGEARAGRIEYRLKWS